MKDICRIFFVFYSLYGNVKCLIPGLSVHNVDRKVIEKKRQDTFEICRIFEEQNELLKKISNNKNEELKHRHKRDVSTQDIENPFLNIEVLKNVEKIVDKLYDDTEDNNQKVTYRRRSFNYSTTTKMDVNSRRFNFAPASLLGPPKEEKNAEISLDIKENKMPWTKKWYHGIVPYFIDASSYDVHLAEIIIKAFDYFEKVTCIRLQRLRDRPIDKHSLQSVEWLYISNPSGIRQCVHSNERKPNNGVQMVVIGYDCMSLGEIAHEVMHILGFSHEHSRPDRDRYITILWDNIKAGYKKYFSVRQEDPLLHLPYDYASVLHYPPRAFSKNGQITLMTENGVKIGQREALSEIDIQKVSIVYNTECTDRNKEYLIETCPSVINAKSDSRTATTEEINDYFRERIWPYGIVNYKIMDSMEFTTEEKENIQAVMRHIEKETCIEFRDLNAYKVSSEEEEDSNEIYQHATSPANIIQDDTGNPSNDNRQDNDLRQKTSYTRSNRLLNYTAEPFKDIDNEIIARDENLDDADFKLSKGPKRTKRNIVSPLRRHAANILTLVRSTEPSCQCHPPGRPNGNKELIINNDCFNSVNDLLHVFVHVLGLDHQHNMHDRDSFLKILWDNLTPEIKSEMMQKLPPAASAGFAYDYQSVMHYPWLQIKDGVTNIMYPIWNDGWAMGHWQGLSYTDVQKLNLIYKEQCALRSQSVLRKKNK